MLKSERQKGNSGDLWFNEAWFTISANGQPLRSTCLSIEDTYPVKDALLYFNLTEDVKSLREARKAMQSENAYLVRAFPRLRDAQLLLSWQRYHEGLKRITLPARNFVEQQILELFKIFPKHPDDKIDLLMFHGQEVCPDPRFGKDRSDPGSRPVDRGIETLSGYKWWQYPNYGFDDGLWLVRFDPHDSIYRLSSETLLTLKSELFGSHDHVPIEENYQRFEETVASYKRTLSDSQRL